MIINITRPQEVSDSELFDFFLYQVGLELPFEQFIKYFDDKDLGRAREIWKDATEYDAKRTKEYNEQLGFEKRCFYY